MSDYIYIREISRFIMFLTTLIDILFLFLNMNKINLNIKIEIPTLEISVQDNIYIKKNNIQNHNL